MHTLKTIKYWWKKLVNMQTSEIAYELEELTLLKFPE